MVGPGQSYAEMIIGPFIPSRDQREAGGKHVRKRLEAFRGPRRQAGRACVTPGARRSGGQDFGDDDDHDSGVGGTLAMRER
ncbi:hypothetical protein HDG37_000101 [Paraburkholderia sp. MM5384-R2]|nr:hypothetical protein [Paraburkholderia sp. MM5384-R2]